MQLCRADDTAFEDDDGYISVWPPTREDREAGKNAHYMRNLEEDKAAEREKN